LKEGKHPEGKEPFDGKKKTLPLRAEGKAQPGLDRGKRRKERRKGYFRKPSRAAKKTFIFVLKMEHHQESRAARRHLAPKKGGRGGGNLRGAAKETCYLYESGCGRNAFFEEKEENPR